MLDTIFELLPRVRLAPPAIDLGPSRHPGLHAMPSEIAVHHLLIEPVRCLCVERVRTRADDREVSEEDDVEELRQLVEARLADEATYPRDARIAAGDKLVRLC